MEADAIAAQLAGLPERLLTSPARRCVQTFVPLADALGLELEEDERLFEGAEADEVAALLAEIEDQEVACCSHGDVIPILLHQLVDAGLRPERNLVWQKASVWIAERADGSWGTGRYLPPPDRA